MESVDGARYARATSSKSRRSSHPAPEEQVVGGEAWDEIFRQPFDSRLRGLLLILFLCVLLKNTWLSEDAFITYRVVDNFIHGLGLRWNPIERVQVYTHPLWMMAVSVVYFVFREMYVAPVVLSLACSGLAIWLLFFRALKSPLQCIIAGLLLTFSKSFVDYSTSGLENPLSHLLLVLFFIEYLKPDESRKFGRMVWFAGLGILNRMDLVWLFLPALGHLTWRHEYWRVRYWRAWAGCVPFLCWELFAILYYGFPFPNSAYAKLATGVSFRALVSQGGCYFVNSLAWDPITLFSMGALLCIAVQRWRRDTPMLMLSLGVALSLGYTLVVGGDYMSGRFFSAPFLVSLMVLSKVQFGSKVELVTVTGILLALGFSSPRPPIQTRDQYIGLGSAPQSVDDEMGYRHDDTSLLMLNRERSLRDAGGWVADGVAARREHKKVTVSKNIGYYGFFAGPDVHIIDPYGIGDALMARIPFHTTDRWAAGHFYRQVPDGYPEAAIGEGEIKNPAVASYWERLKLVTRGKIFDGARLMEILRFNLGMVPRPPG